MTLAQLFPNLKPRYAPVPEAIDLRCCNVEDLLNEVRGARLVIADPPGQYANNPGGANPEENGIYHGLPDSDIVSHLDRSYDCAAQNSRLAVWYTWPKEAEWADASLVYGGYKSASQWAGPRWGSVKSGGAWLKTGMVSVGYHWRGQTEPVALFTKGATGRCNEVVLNGYSSVPDEHSFKPVEWMRGWIRAWTEPGDLIFDPYAGLGSVAISVAMENQANPDKLPRRYIGAEIDPERHRKALVKINEVLQ
jgi:hypothetical protein